MSDATGRLDALVNKSRRLCTLPAVAMKVLELTENPQVDTRALKECIENDPALTGKILGVVNSSLFGLSREVSSLTQALALLGTKPLKLLVLGFSLPGGLFSGLSGEILARYWRRTLTKAVAARELAESVWHISGDEAFLVGLLQDVGTLVLIQELGTPYAMFLEKVYSAGGDVLRLEAQSLGFDHRMLSSRLLTLWGLPESLVDAVGWRPEAQQHEALAPKSFPLAEIVALAELMTQVVVDGCEGALAELLRLAAEYQRLSSEELDQLMRELEQGVQQLADILSLNLPQGVSCQDLLSRAHARLSEMAAGMVEELLCARHASDGECNEAFAAELSNLAKSWNVSLSAGRLGQATSSVPPPARLDMFQAVAPSETARNAVGARLSGTPPAELLAKLETAVAACRQARRALSLLLVELQDAEKLASLLRQPEGSYAARLLRTLCLRLEQPGMTVAACGQEAFAVILPDCDRRQAAELGNQLIAKMRQVIGRTGDASETAALSAGAATVALPPKNFRAADLFTAASRCLFGSRASGGGVMKSIEIY